MKTYNPYPAIDLDFDEDNKWFYMLFNAILKIDYSFITYNINVEYKQKSVDYNNAEIDANDHVERVFAYELYRQWANIMEHYGIRSLALNGEIKKIIRTKVYNKKTNKSNPKDVYPDIVLHHSQENDDMQIIACEIKRSKDLNGKKIFEDLHKLSCYMSKEIFWKKPFLYGVFIIAGKEASLEKIKNIRGNTKSNFVEDITFKKFKEDKDLKTKFKNIVCISYDGSKLEYETLEKLLYK